MIFFFLRWTLFSAFYCERKFLFVRIGHYQNIFANTMGNYTRLPQLAGVFMRRHSHRQRDGWRDRGTGRKTEKVDKSNK